MNTSTYYNYRYFLPYAPEWGSSELCSKRLDELIVFCKKAEIDAVQFYVNTLPGTYYMPAHSADEQRHWAEWMKETVASRLRENDISYQLNFQMILGATSYGLDMRDEYEWDFLVDQYGDESLGCACPLSQRFREKMGEMLNLWAFTKPDIIWIDDDFRMHNHGLITPRGDCDFYCYCKTHLLKFAKFAGREYTREELVREILKPGTPSELRIQWMDFLGQTMTETSEWINRQVQDVSPETRLALMTSCPDVHSVEGRDWKALLNSLSGKYIPITRPMCGIYTGTNVPIKNNACTYKYMSQSMNTLEQIYGADGIEFGPELENTRFTTWSKSVANSRYVMILSQLLGAPQITLSLNDLEGSPIEQEPTTVPLLRDTKPVLQALASLNLRKWRKQGVIFVNDPHSARKFHLEDNSKMQDLGMNREWEDVLLQCGIPAYHASCAEAASGRDVVVLEGYTAWCPSDDELMKILSGSVLLDADAAFVLQERGFGKYLGVSIGKRQTFGIMAEKYRIGTINKEEQRIPHRGFKWRNLVCDGAEVTSEYIDAKNRIHIGSAIFNNEKEGRIAIYNNVGDLSPAGNFGDHVRIGWLHGLLAWLSDGKFPVLPKIPHHGLCIVRTHGDEVLIALANLGAEPLSKLIFLTTYRSSRIEIMDEFGKWKESNCAIEQEEFYKYGRLAWTETLNTFNWMILRLRIGKEFE